jgi:glycosyltransferase involved in cell wall biosynthesis
MKDRYEVVVGIPSYNESKTIKHVVETAGKGLAQFFPDSPSIIINCDNNSPDDTRGAFLSASVPPEIGKHYISTPEGVTGKGNNFWNLFQFCQKVGAQVVIVVDADLRSITPEWIKYLAYPVRDGYDLVVPLYSRHQFDGTITNHLCYPLVFSLTGLNIRQPIGGDFAFSSQLCSYWLEQPWNDMVRQYGIDIFMSLNALFGDFKVCQAGLGTKVHNASSPKLGRMFEEVVYTLFSTIIANRTKWLDTWLRKNAQAFWQSEVAQIACYGMKRLKEAQWLDIDILKLKQDCRDEYEKYEDLVEKYLSPYAYRKIDHMFAIDNYDVDIMLWSQIVYSLLYLFDGAMEEEKYEIINILKPLYFARSLTFDYETWRYSINFAEEEVQSQALAFLSQKPYLFGLYLGEGKCTFPG